MVIRKETCRYRQTNIPFNITDSSFMDLLTSKSSSIPKTSRLESKMQARRYLLAPGFAMDHCSGQVDAIEEDGRSGCDTE